PREEERHVAEQVHHPVEDDRRDRALRPQPARERPHLVRLPPERHQGGDVVDDEPRDRDHEELHRADAVAVAAEGEPPGGGVQQVDDEPDEKGGDDPPAARDDPVEDFRRADPVDKVNEEAEPEEEEERRYRGAAAHLQNTETLTYRSGFSFRSMRRMSRSLRSFDT